MLARLAPLAPLGLLPLAACTAFTPTSSTQARDQEMHGTLVRVLPAQSVRTAPDGTVDLSELWKRQGVRFVDGAEPDGGNPALAQAWRSGEAPPYGLLGSNGEQRLRTIELRTVDPWDEARAEVRARALHPVPFELLLARGGDLDGEGGTELARTASSIWGGTEGAEGPGVHYAELRFPVPDDDVGPFTRLRATVVEQETGWSVATVADLRLVLH